MGLGPTYGWAHVPLGPDDLSFELEPCSPELEYAPWP
jgi:hypothetical protein